MLLPSLSVRPRPCDVMLPRLTVLYPSATATVIDWLPSSSFLPLYVTDALSSMDEMVCSTDFCKAARSVLPFVPLAASSRVERSEDRLLTVSLTAPAAVDSMEFAVCVLLFDCATAPILEYVRWMIA